MAVACFLDQQVCAREDEAAQERIDLVQYCLGVHLSILLHPSSEYHNRNSNTGDRTLLRGFGKPCLRPLLDRVLQLYRRLNRDVHVGRVLSWSQDCAATKAATTKATVYQARHILLFLADGGVRSLVLGEHRQTDKKALARRYFRRVQRPFGLL